MRNVEIVLPRDVPEKRIEHAIDLAIAAGGLGVTLRDTLKAFPGCTHWHVKNGREPGTLEITFWPEKRRAWFSVQGGRKASWINKRMKLLRDAICEQLGDS